MGISSAKAYGVPAAWFGLVASLAAAGALKSFEPPPKVLVLVGISWFITLGLALSPVGKRLAEQLPLAFLVGFQAFRIPVELVLHHAYTHGVIPERMTYSGMNFDILSGITGLVLGLVLAKRALPKVAVLLWNIIGLGLLMTIVSLAVMSTPGPLQVYTEGVANVWITDAPFIWLPTMMVQLAFLGHFLVFRRLLAAVELPVAAPASQNG